MQMGRWVGGWDVPGYTLLHIQEDNEKYEEEVTSHGISRANQSFALPDLSTVQYSQFWESL